MDQRTDRKLIVGLGNPTECYRWTRHNIGVHVVEAVAQKYSLRFVHERCCLASIARGVIEQSEMIVAIPTTFMNDSGIALKKLVQFFHIDSANLLIVLDDIETAWSDMKIAFSGGARGHNGMKSILKELGTNTFSQLRIGVGRPNHGTVADFVLQPFRQDEREALPDIVERGCDLVQKWIN